MLAVGQGMGEDNQAWHDQSQTARERSAQEATLNNHFEFGTVNSGQSKNFDVYTNSRSSNDVFELASFRFDNTSDYSENVWIETQVFDGGGTGQFAFHGHPPNFPVPLDPGLPVKPNWNVDLEIQNNTANNKDFFYEIIVREL